MVQDSMGWWSPPFCVFLDRQQRREAGQGLGLAKSSQNDTSSGPAPHTMRYPKGQLHVQPFKEDLPRAALFSPSYEDHRSVLSQGKISLLEIAKHQSQRSSKTLSFLHKEVKLENKTSLA